MEIVIKGVAPHIVGEMGFGDMFLHAGELYLYTASMEVTRAARNAIRISNREWVRIADHEVVQRVTKLTVEAV
jgi:hypothetical protein